MSEFFPLDSDSYGFPIIPDTVEMSDEVRTERKRKAAVISRRRDEAIARTDLDEELRDELEQQALTSEAETRELIIAGLSRKVIDIGERDVVPEYGPPYDEGVRLGVRWSADSVTGMVHLGLHGYQMIDGACQSFESLVWGDTQGVFMPEELDVLCEIADSHTV